MERTQSFSHGFHPFVKDAIMNFQANRWATFCGKPLIDDLYRVGPRIANFADWKREFLTLAEKALQEGDPQRAAYCFRSVDFFAIHDPDRPRYRRQFLDLIRKAHGVDAAAIDRVPFEGSCLHAFRLPVSRPRDVVVIHGGYDSYVEEFLPVLRRFQEQGYEVIAFEGPGQGTTLEEYGLHLTPDWHKPVAAVLDFYQKTDVTLIGVSLGGVLVTRAAALEPRVKRYIAWNGLVNLFEHFFTKAGPKVVRRLSFMLDWNLRGTLNRLFSKHMDNPYIDWSINQGLHIMGAKTPFDMYRACRTYETRSLSHLVRQDVLVLGSSDDSVQQFYEQIRLLTKARSVTARLFTEAEDAHHHCGVGNLDLVCDAIFAWLADMQNHPVAERCRTGASQGA